MTGHQLEDKQLVEKVLRGDTPAFRVIVQNTERLVARIVCKMIPQAEDRKDIAQDIYVKVYKKLPGFKFEARLSTWIAQVSYNTCLDYLRKKKLLLAGTLSEDSESPGRAHLNNQDLFAEQAVNPMRQKEIATILQTAIEQLSPVYKTLITLYHHEEMSYDEIGQITGLPAGTVKSYLFRARQALKNHLLGTYKKEDL